MYICLVVGFNVSLCEHTSINKKFILKEAGWFKMTRKQKSPTSIRKKLILYKVHLDMRLVWFLIANTKVKMHLDTRLVWLPERARLNLERLDLLLANYFAVFMPFWWPSDHLLLPHWFAVSILCWWSSDFLLAHWLAVFSQHFAIFISYLVMIIKLGN